MEREPNFDWAIFMQYKWDPDATDPHPYFSKPVQTKEEAIRMFLEMDPPWQTMAPLWKKKTMERVTGFDESLFYMEDPDLHLRALLNTSLEVSFQNRLPADCFYRISDMSSGKKNVFYHHSITSRFAFLYKVLGYLPGDVPDTVLSGYKSNIRSGFLEFVKTFVLARVKDYDEDLKKAIIFLVQQKVLSPADKRMLLLARKIFLSNSVFIPLLRARGIMYKLISS